MAAGTFSMGGSGEYDGKPILGWSGERDGKPIHQVTISKAFYMSDHEVTQKEWVEVMGSNPCHSKGDDLPVEKVSWYDAIEYCNKRSVKEGLTPAYTIDKTRKDEDNKNDYDDVKWVVTWNKSANGYRLPTEAEWEFAARGGVQSKDWEYAGGTSAGTVAWFGDNSGSKTHPVKTKKANEAGLYDMSGNVWEWCWDWREGYKGDSQTDPTGVSSGPGRVVRGGSWYDDAAYVRSACRGYDSPSRRSYALGFRLVRP
jgi:formylglycine-generating enzyme required for sulfatase activity